MSASRDVVPFGRYCGRVVSRTTITQPSQGALPNRPSLELTVRISEGDYTGRVLTFPIWGEARMQRARSLRSEQRVVLAVTELRLKSGRMVNRVTDFWAADDSSAADVGTNGRGQITARGHVQTFDGGLKLPNDLRVRLERMGESSALDAEQSGSDVRAAAIAAELNVAGHGDDYRNGFFWVGAKHGRRTVIEYEPVLAALAEAGGEGCGQEPAFLSVFQYTADLRAHQEANTDGSLAGYRGRAWARWLAIDIDGDDSPGGLDRTLREAAKIVDVLSRQGIPLGRILVFFSGSRGVHILFPTAAFGAGPKADFEGAAKRTCLAIAELAGVTIDSAIYNPLAPLRAPNTRHEKSGLFKVLLPAGDLAHITAADVREMATSPRPFAMPDWRLRPLPVLVDVWMWACTAAPARLPAASERSDSDCFVFSDTIDLLVHGAPEGTRGERYFKAFMNVLECGCSPEFAAKLFGRSAQLCGYPGNEFMSQLDGAVKAHAVYGIGGKR